MLKRARKRNLDNEWALYFKQNITFPADHKNKAGLLEEEFNENKHNGRKLWNLIKCLYMSRSGIEKLTDNNTVITDRSSIAELFNTFFVNYPLKLISKQSAHMTGSINPVNQVESAF